MEMPYEGGNPGQGLGPVPEVDLSDAYAQPSPDPGSGEADDLSMAGWEGGDYDAPDGTRGNVDEDGMVGIYEVFEGDGHEGQTATLGVYDIVADGSGHTLKHTEDPLFGEGAQVVVRPEMVPGTSVTYPQRIQITNTGTGEAVLTAMASRYEPPLYAETGVISPEGDVERVATDLGPSHREGREFPDTLTISKVPNDPAEAREAVAVLVDAYVTDAQRLLTEPYPGDPGLLQYKPGVASLVDADEPLHQDRFRDDLMGSSRQGITRIRLLDDDTYQGAAYNGEHRTPVVEAVEEVLERRGCGDFKLTHILHPTSRVPLGVEISFGRRPADQVVLDARLVDGAPTGNGSSQLPYFDAHTPNREMVNEPIGKVPLFVEQVTGKLSPYNVPRYAAGLLGELQGAVGAVSWDEVDYAVRPDGSIVERYMRRGLGDGGLVAQLEYPEAGASPIQGSLHDTRPTNNVDRLSGFVAKTVASERGEYPKVIWEGHRRSEEVNTVQALGAALELVRLVHSWGDRD